LQPKLPRAFGVIAKIPLIKRDFSCIKIALVAAATNAATALAAEIGGEVCDDARTKAAAVFKKSPNTIANKAVARLTTYHSAIAKTRRNASTPY